MKIKSKFCVFLCLTLILSISVVINAGQTSQKDLKDLNQLEFTYIDSFVINFDIIQYGYATIAAYMSGYGVDQVELNVYLQQYINGSWQTIKTWNNIENGSWCSLSRGWFVTRGYLYRCITYGYVYISGYIVESDSIIDYVYY